MAETTTAAGTRQVRGLSVKQPWTWAICHGGKPVENRTWPVPDGLIGALLFLHASRSADAGAFADPRIAGLVRMPARRALPAGAVVGTARLVGSHLGTADCCGPWGDPGAHHWQLEDIRVLSTPIPYRGALGFWRPDAGLRSAVAEALPSTGGEAR